MEVSKAPTADVSSARAGTATTAELGSQPAVPIAPMVDHADIRPLDVSGALQILLAEIRTALDLPLEVASASALISLSSVPAAQHLLGRSSPATLVAE
jgi:hypothetical protein